VAALDSDDVEQLSTLPGIGKKTAQKIILTLKGKLTPAGGGPFRASEDDIATALVGMGFDRRTAKAAVAEALKSLDAGLAAEDLERELFRKAVAIAGKGGKA
jgi:Holliday junction DNA helicase RuvA